MVINPEQGADKRHALPEPNEYALVNLAGGGYDEPGRQKSATAGADRSRYDRLQGSRLLLILLVVFHRFTLRLCLTVQIYADQEEVDRKI